MSFTLKSLFNFSMIFVDADADADLSPRHRSSHLLLSNHQTQIPTNLIQSQSQSQSQTPIQILIQRRNLNILEETKEVKG